MKSMGKFNEKPKIEVYKKEQEQEKKNSHVKGSLEGNIDSFLDETDEQNKKRDQKDN